MTKAIWKFPLRLQAHQIVNMPRGAEILTAQIQHMGEYGKAIGESDFILVWALIENPDNPAYVERKFYVIGTGHLLEGFDFSKVKYVATVQQDEDRFVWHVFVEHEKLEDGGSAD